MRVRPCRSEIKGHYAVCCMCYEAFGIGNDTALVVHKDCKNLTSMPCSNVKKANCDFIFFFFSFYLSVFLILFYFSCLSEMVSSSKRVSVLFIFFLSFFFLCFLHFSFYLFSFRFIFLFIFLSFLLFAL